MGRFIVRAIRLTHCKKGPERCEKCKEMESDGVCLLDTEPPEKGMVQRPVIKVMSNDGPLWKEFDVVRQFQNKEEALEYAQLHKIEDISC